MGYTQEDVNNMLGGNNELVGNNELGDYDTLTKVPSFSVQCAAG